MKIRPISQAHSSSVGGNAKVVRLTFHDIANFFENTVRPGLSSRGLEPDLILGVTTGGAIIGRFVGILWNIPYSRLAIIDAKLAERIDTGLDPSSVLIIDDFGDRGKTMALAVDTVRRIWPGAKVVTVNLYHSNNVTVEPDFSMGTIDNVNFDIPWDGDVLEHRETLPDEICSELAEELEIIHRLKIEYRRSRWKNFGSKRPFSPDFLRAFSGANRLRLMLRVTGDKPIAKWDECVSKTFLRRLERITIPGGRIRYVIGIADHEPIELIPVSKSSASAEFECRVTFASGRPSRCRKCHQRTAISSTGCQACAIYIRTIVKMHRCIRRLLARDVSVELVFTQPGMRIAVPGRVLRSHLAVLASSPD